METAEGNKLIAIFDMPENTLDGDWVIWHDSHRTRQHVSTLKYHEDWNSLMRVLLKISDIHYPDYWNGRQPDDAGEWDNCAYPRTFGMRNTKGEYMVRLNANILFSAPTLIEAAWLAVVDFIKGYNEVENPQHKKVNQ